MKQNSERFKQDFIRQKRHQLGIYIHWPFCESKCPYCDFNSHLHLRHYGSLQEHCSALISSLRYAHNFTCSSSRVASIFFGGGTPSLIPPLIIENIITEISRLWKLCAEVEITLEANPSSSERQRFRGYHKAGINRVSIGAQALNDADLKILGRRHSAKDAEKAIAMAADIFPSYSFDLIHSRMNQKLTDWQNELQKALKIADNHISLYELTIEPNTVFATQFKKGKLTPLTSEVMRDFFILTRDICKDYGFISYEISNFSRNNNPCRHNLNYWQSGDYIGVGAGAHGRLWQNKMTARLQMINENNPAKFLKRIKDDSKRITDNSIVDCHETLEEFLMMGLRLRQGICLETLELMFNKTIETDYLQKMLEQGWVIVTNEGNNLALTDKGLLLCNYFISDIIEHCIQL